MTECPYEYHLITEAITTVIIPSGVVLDAKATKQTICYDPVYLAKSRKSCNGRHSSPSTLELINYCYY